MNNKQLYFMLGFASALGAIGIAMEVTGTANATLTNYPDWVVQKTQKCTGGLFDTKCEDAPTTEAEKNTDWVAGCSIEVYQADIPGQQEIRRVNGHDAYTDPRCIENIVDDRLTPIQKQLDRIEKKLDALQTTSATAP